MLDEYLLAQLDPDTPHAYYNNADQVRLQNALNKIETQEGIELWRGWNKLQRQKFFFLAARVEDLDTWTRIAQITWIAALRNQLYTELQDERTTIINALDAREQALDTRERGITLSIATALQLQTANDTLRATDAKQKETIDKQYQRLRHRDEALQAATDLAGAITRLQEHISKERAIA